MDPFRLSARALLTAYRSRALSPVEAMASVIARVERFEPHISATWLYAPERALAAARASEARWLRGEPIGPLDGVPVTIKDNIAHRGRADAGRDGGGGDESRPRPTRRPPRG